MLRVSLILQRADGAESYATVVLPGVPRIGESIIHGIDQYLVKTVTYDTSDSTVTLFCKG